MAERARRWMNDLMARSVVSCDQRLHKSQPPKALAPRCGSAGGAARSAPRERSTTSEIGLSFRLCGWSRTDYSAMAGACAVPEQVT